MYAILDHEDLVKSRKALMSASFILLILSIFEIADGNISVAGLNIKFDRDASLGLTCLFVLYFMFIFIIRCFEFRLPETLKKSAEKMKGSINQEIDHHVASYSQPIDESSPDADFGYLDKKLKTVDRILVEKTDIIKLVCFLAADALPPLLISIYALYRVESLTILRSFIG